VFARSKRTVLAVIPCVAALVAGTSTVATADTSVFADRRGDTGHPADITSVRVAHGPLVVVAVHHRNLTFTDAPGALRVGYDTGRRYRGPEFYLRLYYQSDQSIELRSAQGWGRLHGAPVPGCRGERVSVSAGQDVTRISVPRACFGNPPRLRVHVRLNPRAGDHRKVDVAPRSRTMGPWVVA
jgi:hypothetical protein